MNIMSKLEAARNKLNEARSLLGDRRASMKCMVKLITKDNFTYTIATTEVPWLPDMTDEANLERCRNSAEDFFRQETEFLFDNERPVPFYLIEDEGVVVHINNIKTVWIDFCPTLHAEYTLSNLQISTNATIGTSMYTPPFATMTSNS